MASTEHPILAETVRVVGYEGDRIPAYVARPVGAGPFPGVVMIHHAPGYDEPSKEILRSFAAHGYAAIMPNLHYRDAPPTADPAEASAAARAAGNVPDLRCIGDVEGSVAWLRTLDSLGPKLGCIGFCFGGREAFVVSGHLPFDATIMCYGGSMLRLPDEIRRPFRAIDLAPNLAGAVLGLFGAQDKNPSPDDVLEMDQVLTEHGKEHRLLVFEGAGHAFFAVNRESYNWRAAKEGWAEIWSFLALHLDTRRPGS